VHKALALTIEIVLLSVLSSILFGTELGVIGVVSVFVVASGTFMYSGYAWEDLMQLLQGGSLPGLIKTSSQEKDPAAVAGGAQKQDMANASTAEKGQLIV
jgi:hypothetical protein